MPQFTIPTMTAVTITSVNVRSELHGEDRVPAVDIGMKLSARNDVLSEFDGALRSMLYQKVPKGHAASQGELDGVEPVSDLPMLRSTNLQQPLRLKSELVGCTLTIDRGLGGSSNIVVSGCKVNHVRVDCKEGGSVDLMFRVQAANLTGDVIGKLAPLLGCETHVTLHPPADLQAPIDGTVVAFERETSRKRPKKTATDIFVDSGS